MAKSFSNDKIIAVIQEGNGLAMVTAGGDEKHLGGHGGNIKTVINSSDHAIIIHNDGCKIMFRFADQSMRQI